MDIFTQITLLMALGAVLVWGVQRFGQSAIFGYLLLGLLAGPSGFQLLPQHVSASELSEIGLVFLLFFIGLEFELHTLQLSIRLALVGSLVQVGATAAAIAAIVLARGGRLAEGIILGIGLGLSSTAIVVKAYEEKKEADSATAKTALTVLLGQDLVAMIASAILPLTWSGGSMPWSKLLGLFIGVPALFLIANRFLPKLLKAAAVARDSETFGLASLASCLLVAVGSHALGASMGLGAFLGGLVFANSPFKHQMRADLATIKHLALGFFFLCIGMLIQGRYIIQHLPLIICGLVVLMVLKATIAIAVFRLFKSPWSIAAGAGLAISQAGEFTFVIATAARDGGVVSSDFYQLAIALAILTMVPAPMIVARSRRFGQWAGGPLSGEDHHAKPKERREKRARDPEQKHSANDDDTIVVAPNRAIVVGYGPVGKTLCRILERFGVRPCVIDLKTETIQRLIEIGRDAVFGDAGRREVLLAAGVDKARYLMITLPDYASRMPIITSARQLNPKITIFSRARYLGEQRGLELAGVTFAAYEECEVAAELARLLLTELNVESHRIDREVSRLRSEISMRTGFTRAMPRLDAQVSAEMLREISESLTKHDPE